MPGEHRDGDSWVTQLYERPILRINALSGQQDVLGAHIPMHQILVLLQGKSRERTVRGSESAPGYPHHRAALKYTELKSRITPEKELEEKKERSREMECSHFSTFPRCLLPGSSGHLQVVWPL